MASHICTDADWLPCSISVPGQHETGRAGLTELNLHVTVVLCFSFPWTGFPLKVDHIPLIASRVHNTAVYTLSEEMHMIFYSIQINTHTRAHRPS